MNVIDFEFDNIVFRRVYCFNCDNCLLFILNDSFMLCDLKVFMNFSFGFMSLNNDLLFVDLNFDFYGIKFIGYGFFMLDRY